jgi:hypothetical protein
MAVAWIDDLDVNLEAGWSKHEARHSRGFVPFKVRARSKTKAALTSGMIDERRLNANRFIAVCIIVGNNPDISRHTNTGVDGARP